MSVIAKAIADRQSEIERLQAETKALNDVDKIPWGLCPGEARGSALLLAADGGCRHPGKRRSPAGACLEGSGPSGRRPSVSLPYCGHAAGHDQFWTREQIVH